uniref:Putative tick transposon n=1 Tax=Ixodes ricinus TaxID=34613 RepID=A0A6B0V5U0_IXORI
MDDSAHHGRIPEFFPGGNWSSWLERLEFYFEAKNITSSAKKRAVLLTSCGESTYDTVRALLAPKKPSEVEVEDIIKSLNEHYDPKPAELLSRFKFHQRNQTPTESISEYVAALRKIAADCNFGPVTTAPTTPTPATATAAPPESDASSSQESRQVPQAPARKFSTVLPLQVMLRDRFICGVKDSHLQQRLLVERNITFDRAYALALATESAASQQLQMRKQGKVSSSTATTGKRAKLLKRNLYPLHRYGFT